MSPGIELLRGWAALMVVVAHYRGFAGIDAWPSAFSFTGVDLFFVISGFVFAPYLAGKPVQWDAFLIRRFFRIYPLYLVALLFYILIRWRAHGEVAHVGSHLLFLHTLQSRDIAFFFNPAFWSLPVEVEYYLLLPLLAWMVRGGRAFALLLLLAVVAHALVAWNQPADQAAETWPVVLAFHLPGLLVEFLLGAAAWLLWQRRPSRGVRLVLFAVGMALWVTLAAVFEAMGDAGVHANRWLRGNLPMLSALSYALMLCAVLSVVDRASARVRHACLHLGNLSFGIYLLHNAMPPLLAPWQPKVAPWAFAGLCLLATVLAAALLHRMVEAPMRRVGRAIADARERARAVPA